MTPMHPPLPLDMQRTPRTLRAALAISLLLHALILFLPQRSHPRADQRSSRLDVLLAPSANKRPQPESPPASPLALTAPVLVTPKPSPPPTPARTKILAVKPTGKNKPEPSAESTPHWSPAEKNDMNKFLNELDQQARSQPSLAQRALAMAVAIGRQAPQHKEDSGELVERLPDSPPPDPFSLEMYLDSLVKKLNKSAAFVRNDPRQMGIKQASVVIRLNPDGSLKSFEVLNAGDQKDNIAFIRSVVERAIPFASFPSDLRKSAKSLGLLICIEPPSLSGGDIGFSRREDGRGC
jgi:hypothetical protein